MKCPHCGHSGSQVKDSRTTDDGFAIRRRRQCLKCQGRFTTFERIQLRELTVLKRDGSAEPFDREKLYRSLRTALRKRKIKDEDLESVVDSIVKELEQVGESEVTVARIGEAALRTLSVLDPVAYVRFASVYKNFENVGDFLVFIKKEG